MNPVTLAKVIVPVGAVGLGASVGSAFSYGTKEGFTPGQAIVTASVATLAGAIGAAIGNSGGTSGMISGALAGAGLIASLAVVPNLIPDSAYEKRWQ